MRLLESTPDSVRQPLIDVLSRLLVNDDDDSAKPRLLTSASAMAGAAEWQLGWHGVSPSPLLELSDIELSANEGEAFERSLAPLPPVPTLDLEAVEAISHSLSSWRTISRGGDGGGAGGGGGGGGGGTGRTGSVGGGMGADGSPTANNSLMITLRGLHPDHAEITAVRLGEPSTKHATKWTHNVPRVEGWLV